MVKKMVIDNVFCPDKEFLEFVNKICNQVDNLTVGVKHSANRNYTIVVLEEFNGEHGGNENPVTVTLGENLHEINKGHLIFSKYNNTKAILYFWIIWMFIMDEVEYNYVVSSTIATNYCVSIGFSKSDLMNDFIETIKVIEDDLNLKRTKNIINLLSANK